MKPIQTIAAGAGLALALICSVRADFNPIPLTPGSFNADVIIEKTARAPLQLNISATMDGGTNLTGATWFESGLLGSTAGRGVPVHGATITAPALAGSGHRYRMPATYIGPCSLFINVDVQGGTLALDTPAAFTHLSVLGGSGGGTTTLGYLVHFADASPDESGSFTILDWHTTTAASSNSLVHVALQRWDSSGGGVNTPTSPPGNPRLFYNDLALGNTVSPVKSIEFYYISGTRGCLLALSGSTDFGTTYTPQGISGFNHDMVQESPLRYRTTATMDGGTNNDGNTFYQVGFNRNPGTASNSGLPAPGSILVATNDATHQFQLPADYTVNNALLVNVQIPTATLTLPTPVAANVISLLNSSGNGPVTNNYTVHYQDGSTQSGQLICLDWFNSASPCYTVSGRVSQNNSAFDAVGTTNPRLYFSDIALANTASPVTSIDFAYVGGGRTVFLALSGSTGGGFTPIAISGFNRDVVVEAPPISLRDYTTATMDGGTNNNGSTWYERGYFPFQPNSGLPAPGAIMVSTNLPDHFYRMPASYTGPNGIYCDSNNPSATITFTSPTNITAISFLSATANQGVQVRVILNHLNGTSETNTFNAKDWFNGVPAAYTSSGRVGSDNAAINTWAPVSINPRLYEAQFILNDTVSPVTGATIQWTTNNGSGGFSSATSRFVILAVSATAGAVAPIVRNDPVGTSVFEGTNVSMWVGIGGGTEPMSYQWQVDSGSGFVNLVNNSIVTGAISTNLVLVSPVWTNTGSYRLVVSNVAGVTITGPATVSVYSTLPDVTSPTDPIVAYEPNGGSAPAAEDVTHVIDNVAQKYLNRGANQGAPYVGPTGFIVTPGGGLNTVISAFRVYTANDATERDPADYLLEGSNDGGANWTSIATSSLALPTGRNSTGTANVIVNNSFTNFLQEVHFPNTTAYRSYRWSVNTLRDSNTANSMQFAEVELLGALAPAAPFITIQPPPNVKVFAGASPTFAVVANGYPTNLTYQWYLNSVTPIPNATNASYVFPNAQIADTGKQFSCVVANSAGTVNSTVATLTVIAAPATSYAATILGDNPIAYFRLDEGPDDFLGNNGAAANDYVGGHSGVYSNVYLVQPGYSVNDPNPAALFGNFAFADSYAGEINGINFAASTNTPAAFSVEAWINGGAQLYDAGIVTKGAGGGGEQFNLDTGATAGGAHGLRFFVRGANGTIYSANTGTNVPDGNWHHLVGVCDQANSNVLLYVDGVLSSKVTIPPDAGIFSTSHAVSIASRQSGFGTNYNYQFYGTVDEVSIFNYALTEAKVVSHYVAAGVGPTITLQPTNTVASAGSTAHFYAAAIGTPDLAYQWYRSTDSGVNWTQILGQTTPVLEIAGLSDVQNGYQYQLVVSNAYAVVSSAVATLTVVSGPPVIVTDVPALTLVYAGRSFTLPSAFGGTVPIFYRWQKNGVDLSDTTRISGSQSNILTVTDTLGSDQGGYQVLATNDLGGPSLSSMATVLVETRPDFNTNGLGWTLNGTPTPGTIVNNVFTVTDGTGSAARSGFFNFPLYIGAFTASFVYQDVGGGGADGLAFVLQNDSRGLTALGGAGGGLGYSGITPSVALQFNIYSGAAGGVGMAVGAGGVVTTPYTSTSPVSLAGGNPIKVELAYASGVLNITLTDLTTAATYTRSVTANLPALAGGSTAWVGITGATGGTVSTQTVTDFVFVPIPTITGTLAGSNAVLSWPTSIGGYLLETKSDLTTGAWIPVAVPSVIVGGTRQVTVPVSGNQFFRLVLP